MIHFHRQVAVVMALSLLAACAEKPEPGSPVDLRQQVFKRTVKTFEVAEGMARGRVAYQADGFLQAASALQALSHEPWIHFAQALPGKGSRAKADIWQQPQDFKLAIQRYQSAADQLLAVAQRRDASAIQPAVADVEAACAACHKVFRR